MQIKIRRLRTIKICNKNSGVSSKRVCGYAQLKTRRLRTIEICHRKHCACRLNKGEAKKWRL